MDVRNDAVSHLWHGLWPRDAGRVAGRTAADEYQRTMGALFAVYWVMRIGIDGEHGFCYGVGEEWEPEHTVIQMPVMDAKEYGSVQDINQL